MPLILHKPICFFDLETTGLKISSDRIVEIAILKAYPDGKTENKSWRVNPEMPISKEATSVHGISNEDVTNEKTFNEIAPQVMNMMKDSDFAGFNSNRFDIPLLAEEFLRCGIDFDMKKHKAIDVQVIFHKMEPRTLTAAYKYYCNKDLTDAHSADADTFATYEVLKAQLEKYQDLEGDVSSLSNFATNNRSADLAGFIGFDKSENEVFNFGKYKGKKVVDVFEKDMGYYSWLQKADFPLYTKKILTAIKLRH